MSKAKNLTSTSISCALALWAIAGIGDLVNIPDLTKIGVILAIPTTVLAVVAVFIQLRSIIPVGRLQVIGVLLLFGLGGAVISQGFMITMEILDRVGYLTGGAGIFALGMYLAYMWWFKNE